MRLLVAGCAALVVLAPGTAGAAVEPGSGLVSFSLHANAPGIGLEGLYKDVALTVPETSSSLTTGGVGAGFASLAWPGPVVGNLGTTILVLSGSAPPQVTALNSPVRAESRSGGTRSATNTSIPGTVMASTATGTQATASSRTGPATTLPIGTFGALTGSSSTSLTGATSAVSTATSEVQDLVLAGGVLRIGSVRSTATTTTDGTRSTAKGSTVVTGVSVAGVPVEVDGNGVHVAGKDATAPLPLQALNAAVKQLGLTLLVTSPRVVQSGSAASYDAGALVLLYSRGASHYALTLGRASTSVAVTRGQPSGPTELFVPSPPVAGAAVPPSLPGTALAPPPLVMSPGLAAVVNGAPPTTAEQSPALPSQLLDAAAAVALAKGAPAGLALALLLGVGLLGLLLPRLPDRFLTVPLDDECEEQP
jgi:hypothetical protein